VSDSEVRWTRQDQPPVSASMDANRRCAMHHSGLQVATSVEIAKRLSPVDTAAACAVCKPWIGSRGFDPAPVMPGSTPLSATSGMVAIDVAKQRQGPQRQSGRADKTARATAGPQQRDKWQRNPQRESAGQATAGTATVTDNRQQGNTQRRIKKVSAQQKRARAIALALALALANPGGLP